MSVMCPHCHEQKPSGSRVCPKCTREVTAGDNARHNLTIIIIWIVTIGAFFAIAGG